MKGPTNLYLNVTVKKLREAFEDVGNVLLSLPSRSFHTVMQRVPGRPWAVEVEVCPRLPGAQPGVGAGEAGEEEPGGRRLVSCFKGRMG